jgi:hypothetical protein
MVDMSTFRSLVTCTVVHSLVATIILIIITASSIHSVCGSASVNSSVPDKRLDFDFPDRLAGLLRCEKAASFGGDVSWFFLAAWKCNSRLGWSFGSGLIDAHGK